MQTVTPEASAVPAGDPSAASGRPARRRLHRTFAAYVLACGGVVALMLALEEGGLPRGWIASFFLLGPVMVFAVIGASCHTTDADEYYVAARAVPAPYNGLAIAADWMSVASFLGLTGLLYATGQGGLAYLIGWTGGFCLVAMYVAPFLRKSGQYTIPDFLGHRYGSHLPRLVGLAICVLCSFVYVVAQIYGVGLIVSRLTGKSLEVGVFLGLGGVLVCSFLGGMRAVTWTQVAQYVILLVAFLLPVVWLSVRQTGIPMPQIAAAVQLPKLAAREAELRNDDGERRAGAAFAADARGHAAKLARVDAALAEERVAALARREQALASGLQLDELRAANRAVAALPKDADAARRAWTRARDDSERRSQPLAGMPALAQPPANAGKRDPADADVSRLNFMALMVCLMAGTAGMPHVLTRLYTTPTVREARWSVVWALVAIVALYLCAPVLAVLLRWEVLHGVVGLPVDRLPQWISDWSQLDPTLVSVKDVSGDGVLQMAELKISPDILVLAAPEIGAMPYGVTCLVAAGGLSAALSTADGLLLTIANALTHDLFFARSATPLHASTRVAMSKVVLLVVAMLAAYVATLQLAEILAWVTAAFSIAAATIFPALVLGVYWKRAERWGAASGMLAGLGVTLGYLIHAHPALRALRGAPPDGGLWWGIQPHAAGVFGMPVAFATAVVVSWVAGGGLQSGKVVDDLRRP
jgi:cation/acetate symporter